MPSQNQLSIIRLVSITLVPALLLLDCGGMMPRAEQEHSATTAATLSPQLVIPAGFLRRGFQYGTSDLPASRARGRPKKSESQRQAEIQERLAEIEKIVTRCGGIITDLELVQRLKQTPAAFKSTLMFWQWARNAKQTQCLETMGVIRTKVSKEEIAGEQFLLKSVREKSKYERSRQEARLRYALYRLMILYKGFIKLTGQSADLHSRERILNPEETALLEAVTTGVSELSQRIGDITRIYLDVKSSVTGKSDRRKKAQGHLENAIAQLTSNNKNLPAAHAALLSAVEALADDLRQLEKGEGKGRPYWRIQKVKPAAKSKSRKATSATPEADKSNILQAAYLLRRRQVTSFPVELGVKDGASVTIKVYQETKFNTRWQLMQAIDHMVDAERDEVELSSNILKKIVAALSSLRSKSGPRLSGEELRNLALELNPRWLTDKMFVRYGLLVASQLLDERAARSEEATFLARYTERILGLTQRLLREREQQAEEIIKAIENGLLPEARDFVSKQNKDILDKMQRVTPGGAKRRAWQLAKDKVILNEPEFEGLGQVFASLVYAEGNEFKERLEYAQRRVYEAGLLFDFTITFRTEYVKARRIGQPAECRYAVFQNVYAQSVKNNTHVREWPHMRMRFYLAAMQVPLEKTSTIRGSKDKERKRNSVFRLINAAAYLQEIRSFDVRGLLLLPREKNTKQPEFKRVSYPRTRQILDELVDAKKSELYQLSYDERVSIIRAMAQDLGLLPKGAWIRPVKSRSQMSLPFSISPFQGMAPEDAEVLEQALDKFINIKSGVHQEMPDATLASLRDAVLTGEEKRTIEEKFFPYTREVDVYAHGIVAAVRHLTDTTSRSRLSKMIQGIFKARNNYLQNKELGQAFLAIPGGFLVIAAVIILIVTGLLPFGTLLLHALGGVVGYAVGRAIFERLREKMFDDLFYLRDTYEMTKKNKVSIDKLFDETQEWPHVGGLVAGIAGFGIAVLFTRSLMVGLGIMAAGAWVGADNRRSVLKALDQVREIRTQAEKRGKQSEVLPSFSSGRIQSTSASRPFLRMLTKSDTMPIFVKDKSPDEARTFLQRIGIDKEAVFIDADQLLMTKNLSLNLAKQAIVGAPDWFGKASAFVMAWGNYLWYWMTGSMAAKFQIFLGLKRRDVAVMAERLILDKEALRLLSLIKQFRQVKQLDLVIVSDSMEELLEDFFAQPVVQFELVRAGICVRAVMANQSRFLYSRIPSHNNLFMRGLQENRQVIDRRTMMLYMWKDNICIAELEGSESKKDKRFLLQVGYGSTQINQVLLRHRKRAETPDFLRASVLEVLHNANGDISEDKLVQGVIAQHRYSGDIETYEGALQEVKVQVQAALRWANERGFIATSVTGELSLTETGENAYIKMVPAELRHAGTSDSTSPQYEHPPAATTHRQDNGALRLISQIFEMLNNGTKKLPPRFSRPERTAATLLERAI